MSKVFSYWSVGILPVISVFVLTYIIAVVPNLGMIVVSLALFICTPTLVGMVITDERKRKDRVKERMLNKK